MLNHKKCIKQLIIPLFKLTISILCTNALSFYRSKTVLCWSNFFEPALKFIYVHIVPVTNILCHTKRWFSFSKIDFCAGTKVFEEALNAVKFFGSLKKFGSAQNISISKFGFCAGTKGFDEALNMIEFLDRHKTF